MEASTQRRKGMDSLEHTLRKNRESNYTENLTHQHTNFDYAQHSAVPWTHERLSLFAGSPLYKQASASQKLALNHLWWSAFYELIAGAETNTIFFNELCANAFFRLGGYETLCHELDLETSQERYHIAAFREVGRKTERALLGFTVFVLDESEKLPTMSDRMTNGQKKAGQVGAAALGSAFMATVNRSPFMASQYFLIRGIFNFWAKHRETFGYQLHRDLELAGAPIPAPTAIIHYHYLDEAFHTATSQLLSHELLKELPAPSRGEKLMMNLLVQFVRKSAFNHLGSMMGSLLVDDGVALPKFYQVLRSKLFGMSHNEAMHMLEQCYCFEHDGFHSSAEFLTKFGRAARRSLSEVDYLWPEHREMAGLEDVTLDRVLAKNRKTFKQFAKKQRDVAPISMSS